MKSDSKTESLDCASGSSRSNTFENEYVERLWKLTCSVNGSTWEQRTNINVIDSISNSVLFRVNDTSLLCRYRFVYGGPSAAEAVGAYFLNLENDGYYVAVIFNIYAFSVVSGQLMEKENNFFSQTEIDKAFYAPNDKEMMNKFHAYCKFIEFIKKNYVDRFSESLDALRNFLDKKER